MKTTVSFNLLIIVILVMFKEVFITLVLLKECGSVKIFDYVG